MTRKELHKIPNDVIAWNITWPHTYMLLDSPDQDLIDQDAGGSGPVGWCDWVLSITVMLTSVIRSMLMISHIFMLFRISFWWWTRFICSNWISLLDLPGDFHSHYVVYFLGFKRFSSTGISGCSGNNRQSTRCSRPLCLVKWRKLIQHGPPSCKCTIGKSHFVLKSQTNASLAWAVIVD